MSLLRLLTGWKDRVVRSVKNRGVAATTRLAGLLLIKHVIQPVVQLWQRCFTRNAGNPYYQFLDRRYDRRFAVDTAGIHLLPEIIADPRFNAYAPCPMSRANFFRILRQIDVDYSQFLFIDFGCGKGKPLLLASELPFKRIIGIELTSIMARAAEENFKTYRGPQRCAALQVVCCDAVEYVLPQDPTVYYFCDPFVEVVMAKVLDNLRRSLAAAPRQIFLVYVLPQHRRLMDNSGFLTPVKQTASYCIYRS